MHRIKAYEVFNVNFWAYISGELHERYEEISVSIELSKNKMSLKKLR